MICPVRHEVARRGALLHLAPREYRLLLTLAEHPGRVFTCGQLLARIWGDECYDPHVLDAHRTNLRRKIEDDPAHPRYIETVCGMG